MRKTFCDGCGGECGSREVSVNGHVTHRTADGQAVGYDEIIPSDMCGACLEKLQAEYPWLFRLSASDADGDMEVPVRAVELARSGSVPVDEIPEAAEFYPI